MKNIRIYRLVYNNNIIYIGKTILTLEQRKKRANPTVPVEIYESSNIELIEETLDVSRERYWIALYKKVGIKLMNKRDGNHSDKTKKEKSDTYYKDNKEKINARCKSHYKDNKEKTTTRCKSYYQANKEKINARCKAYYLKNKKQ